MAIRGNGYLGSSSLQTSTANQEIIPSATSLGWTAGYSLYKLTFINDQDCTVKINNDKTLFLRARQGFSTDKDDQGITSFIIVESGVSFNWIGAY